MLESYLIEDLNTEADDSSIPQCAKQICTIYKELTDNKMSTITQLATKVSQDNIRPFSVSLDWTPSAFTKLNLQIPPLFNHETTNKRNRKRQMYADDDTEYEEDEMEDLSSSNAASDHQEGQAVCSSNTSSASKRNNSSSHHNNTTTAPVQNNKQNKNKKKKQKAKPQTDVDDDGFELPTGKHHI